jgi:demethylspheroidene O-methyltransferase
VPGDLAVGESASDSVGDAALEPAALARWHDAWLAWRDRRLGSDRFRAWAEAFPLTRWIARRRAREVFDLVAGFTYSQVLLACVQSRLLEILRAEGPMTLRALAPRLDLSADAAERLVLAAVSLRLLERRSRERFGLGALGAPIAGQPGLAALIEHHAALYRDLADPLALLRAPRGGGQLARYWPYAGAPSPRRGAAAPLATYSNLMAATQPLVAGQVLAAYPVQRHRRLLDVGGGDGSFACAAARAAPALDVRVFDLPEVAARARIRFEQAGLGERAQAVGGSFLHDPLPRGADLITLVRVLHDHDDDSALTVLRAIREALPADGRLLLAEPFAETPGAQAMGDAYFGFYLLAMGQGRPRSEARLRQMLQIAGFSKVRRLPTHLPLQCSVLLAEPGFDRV